LLNHSLISYVSVVRVELIPLLIVAYSAIEELGRTGLSEALCIALSLIGYHLRYQHRRGDKASLSLSTTFKNYCFCYVVFLI
jgi:hypothetical protein